MKMKSIFKAIIRRLAVISIFLDAIAMFLMLMNPALKKISSAIFVVAIILAVISLCVYLYEQHIQRKHRENGV
jgi:archaellum biogenesis protein FlaJ (TadC family)